IDAAAPWVREGHLDAGRRILEETVGRGRDDRRLGTGGIHHEPAASRTVVARSIAEGDLYVVALVGQRPGQRALGPGIRSGEGSGLFDLVDEDVHGSGIDATRAV